MTVHNFIDVTERTFVQSTAFSVLGDLWRSSEFVLEPSTTVYQDALLGSLHVHDAASGSVFYNDWLNPASDTPSQYAISGINDLNDSVVTFAWIRPTKNCTVKIRNITTLVSYNTSTQSYELSTNSADRIVGEWGIHEISLGTDDSDKWHLIRAVPAPLTATTETTRYAIGFEIEITYTGDTGELYISRPAITALLDVTENTFFTECLSLIPNTYFGQDFFDPSSNTVPFPLLRLLDILTNDAGNISDDIYHFEYKNSGQGFDPSIPETQSFFITPDLIDNLLHLSWLAQFRGRELLVTYEPSTEGEEWTPFVLDSSELNGTHVVALTSFSVEGISGGVEAYFKWQVDTGYYGHNAGSVSAMLSAINLLLSGAKTINYTMSANQITFETSITETYGSDTLGLSVGDPNPYVLAILEPTRPLGMIITHELIA